MGGGAVACHRGGRNYSVHPPDPRHRGFCARDRGACSGRHCRNRSRRLTSFQSNGGSAMRFSAVLFAGFAAFGLTQSALAADAVPANWVEVAAGAMFTVKAPPGTTFERIRTGDAFAGTFHG